MQEPNEKPYAKSVRNQRKSFYQIAMERDEAASSAKLGVADDDFARVNRPQLSISEAAAMVAMEDESSVVSDDDEIPESVPIPRSRMSVLGRRASYRTPMGDFSAGSSKRPSVSRSSANSSASLKAPPTISRRRSTASSGSRPSSRRASLQSTGSRELVELVACDDKDIKMAAAAVKDEEGPPLGVADEDIMEQHRIMANLEAKQLARQNLGYDLAEVGIQEEPSFEIVDEPTVSLPGLATTSVEYELPSRCAANVPFPFSYDMLVKEIGHREPDLQVGVLSSRQDALSVPGRMAVRCLGCDKDLAVSQMASLVSCPECSTVSSATSTRR